MGLWAARSGRWEYLQTLKPYLSRGELPPQPEQVAAVGKLHDQVGVDGRRHQLPTDEVVPACAQS